MSDGTEIVVVGCLEETRDTLEQLILLGERPDHIVTIDAAEAARQRVSNYVDLRPLAESLNVPCTFLRAYSMKDGQDVAFFATLKPKFLLALGWQRLIPESVLEFVESGTVGFHGSCNMLPWGRGRSPINWSIIEGRDRFALHMFFIEPGVDDGDIIGVRLYDINEWDNCRTVYYKTAIAQAELLARFLPLMRSGDCPRSRQHGDAFYYAKRTPDDGKVDWEQPMNNICRLVRAVTRPYPGAFTHLGDERLSIWAAQPFSRDFFDETAPGEICFAPHNDLGEFVVRCGDGCVLVTDFEGPDVLRTGDRLQ